MFRITLSGTYSQSWKQANQKLEGTATRRIYRWGDMWGILVKDQWSVERRFCILEEENTLLESVELIPTIYAPPMHIDDVWDEELVNVDTMEWNGLLSISGSAYEILQICVKHSVQLPNSIKKYLESIPVTHTRIDLTRKCEVIPQNPKGKMKSFVAKQPIRKSKCLVMDD